MKRNKDLPHYFSIDELADFISQPPALIERLCRCKIHPPWIWGSRWREPRFPIETAPEWQRILDSVDPNTLPENPPPLERPTWVFKQSRKRRDTDLEIILKCLPPKTTERLRTER